MTTGRFIKQSILMPLAVAAFRGHPIRGLTRYLEVVGQFRAYRHLAASQETVKIGDFFPWLLDNSAQAGKAGEYFYQDTWCIRHVAQHKPRVHVDIGSALISMGCLSQVVPVVYVDIRPTPVKLRGFEPLRASLTKLPFADRALTSVSSLSVLEHVGLGRYGDPLDPFGTDRACAELARVIAPGGRLYAAVPTAKNPHVAFNAHRVFAPDDFIAKFPAVSLCDEAYATATTLLARSQYDRLEQPYAYGCFAFTRRG